MMEEKKLVPKRRFQGFDGQWKKISVENLGDSYYGGGTPKTSVSEFWNGDIPWIQSSDLTEDIVKVKQEKNKITKLGLEKSATKLVPKNSIAVVTRVGVGKLAFVPYEFATSQDFLSISNLNVPYEFGAYSLYKLLQEKRKTVQGTSIKGLTKDELLSMTLQIPPALKEQQKIGEFFKVLDERIANQKRKIAKVKALKEAYLTEMFPQEGGTVPKRRFDGFEGDWMKYKLLNQMERIIDFRGRTPKKLGLGWSESGYLALSALNVKNGHIDLKEDAHYGDEVLYQKWMQGNELQKGQVLFTTEAPMGNVAQVPDNRGYILSQRTIAFVTNKRTIVDDFLAVLLRSNLVYNKLLSLSSGGTAKGVSQRTLESLTVDVPLDIKEQQKIGKFFKNLDDQIQTEEVKLEKLKKTKEAYLEEMFV